MTFQFLPLIAAAVIAAPAFAQDHSYWVVDDSFDNVSFAVESAILDKGLTIDSVSHVGEMLERTRIDVGSDVTLYTEGIVFSFCSATVSRTAWIPELFTIPLRE